MAQSLAFVFVLACGFNLVVPADPDHHPTLFPVYFLSAVVFPLPMAQRRGLLQTMNLLLVTLLSSSLVCRVYSQGHPSSLLPAASDSFPPCAVDCSRLHQVDTKCSGLDDHNDALSCFCGSGLLAELRHSPNGTCDDSCSDTSDREALQSWFVDQCSSVNEKGKRDMDPRSGQSPDGNTAGHTLVARYGSPPNWYVETGQEKERRFIANGVPQVVKSLPVDYHGHCAYSRVYCSDNPGRLAEAPPRRQVSSSLPCCGQSSQQWSSAQQHSSVDAYAPSRCI